MIYWGKSVLKILFDTMVQYELLRGGGPDLRKVKIEFDVVFDRGE